MEGSEEIVAQIIKILNSECQFTLTDIYFIILNATKLGDIATLQDYITKCKFTEINQITDEDERLQHEQPDLERMQEIAKIVLTNWDSSGQTVSVRMRQHKTDRSPES